MSVFKIELYDTEEKIVKITEQHSREDMHLHQYGAMLSWWKLPEDLQAVAVAELNGEKVGAVIVTKDDTAKYNLGVFVKPLYRNKGIARQLLDTIKHLKPKFNVDKSEYREKFFNKCLKGQS